MQNRRNLVEQLKELLARKQSKQYYAKRLGVTVGEVDYLLSQIRGYDNKQVVVKEENTNTKRFNIEKGEIEINGYWDHEPSPEEIMEAHNIDTTQWKLSQFWSKQKTKGYQVSALFSQRKADKDNVAANFLEFIKDYKPTIPVTFGTIRSNVKNPNGCLIINKQDAHLNKYDRKGNNNIQDRFLDFENKVDRVLRKATATTNLEKVIYVIGSDIFNSEWTNMTTHGTPQQNILDHNAGFEAICEHEINVISRLLAHSNDVHVMYLVGNHDTFIGWHLATWLKAYFRNVKNVSFDTSDNYSKYVKYSNSALAFNHGYKIKPETLAANFPIEFKEHWSDCDNFTIFVGDLHTELSKQIGGIQFYRLAQVSNSTSKWDEENGYTLSKGTVTAFLIEEGNGNTDIYKA